MNKNTLLLVNLHKHIDFPFLDDKLETQQARMAAAYIPTVTSFGMIVLKNTPTKGTETEILGVNSRNTYAHGCAIAGTRWYSYASVDQDFADAMTFQERTALLTDSEADGYPHFIKCVKRCYSKKLANMSADAAEMYIANALFDFTKLMKKLRPMLLVANRANVDGALPWSFPKGRGSPGEKHRYHTQEDFEIAVAMRETLEETMVTKHMYDVQHQIPPFVIRYVDMGIRYELKLYYAIAHDSIQFGINADDEDQTDEVSDLRWLTKTSLSALPLCSITREHFLGNFDAIDAHYLKYAHRAAPVESLRSSFVGPTALPARFVPVEELAVRAPADAALVDEKKAVALAQAPAKKLYVPPSRRGDPRVYVPQDAFVPPRKSSSRSPQRRSAYQPKSYTSSKSVDFGGAKGRSQGEWRKPETSAPAGSK